jgi:hypothetical protein
MTRSLNQSDITLIRSDEHEKLFVPGSTQTQTPVAAGPPTNRAGPTRVTDRDLQALWSSQLSLRRRTWARTQAIPVHDRAHRRTPTPRLCTERDLSPSRRFSRQLPQASGDAQRDLCNQCRASASPRASRLNGSGCRIARFCPGGRHHCQHDRMLSRCRRPAARRGRSR